MQRKVATDINRKFMFLPLARFHARPLSFKALILAFTTWHFHRKGSIRVEEEKFRIPVDVRGSKTSVLKLSNNAEWPRMRILYKIERCHYVCSEPERGFRAIGILGKVNFTRRCPRHFSDPYICISNAERWIHLFDMGSVILSGCFELCLCFNPWPIERRWEHRACKNHNKSHKLQVFAKVLFNSAISCPVLR